MAEISTNSTIPLLDNKILLQYPTGMQYDDEWVMFRINTDTDTTSLDEDKEYVPPPPSGDNNITFLDSIGDVWESVKKASNEPVNRAKKEGLVELNKVIVLPMPSDHRVNTRIDYDSDYTPSTLVQVGDILQQQGSTAGALAADLAKYGVAAGVSGLANALKAGSASTTDLLKNNRLVWNEVMFKSFGFRSFNLTYLFAPKSEKEAETVRSIIETFRYYSLPELSTSKLFYIFPSEFDILFMKGTKENPTLPKIASCVLRDISVNYTPHSVWSSLPDGSPVAIQVSMEFLELELIDRLRVKNKDKPEKSGY
jgi:hypothetical protein